MPYEGTPELVLPADERSRTQRSRDKQRATEQVTRVEENRNDLEAWNRVAQTVIDNRRLRRLEGARYDLAERIDDRDDPILVVANELLVRTDELTKQERARLRQLGATAIRNLEGRVVRVAMATSSPTDRRQRVSDSIQVPAAAPGTDRRRRHIRAKEHYLAPMGPVMKALCNPEPSEGLRTDATRSAGTGLHIAVVDTGIAASGRGDGWLAGVPETAANRDRLDDFPPVGLDFGAGHGTFAAGIIQQLAPDATIRVYRGLDSDGFGSEANVASRMVQAAKEGAHIINLSFGLETTDGEPPIGLEVAVDIIRRRWPDVLLVAAAGNFGHPVPCWPAAFKGVTAVAGLDRSLRPAAWSSFGSWVDCSTIGEAVLSTFVTGSEERPDEGEVDVDEYGPDAWAIWTGTSFAAPQVAGAVAQLAQAGNLRPRDALAALLADASEVPGFGRAVPIFPPL